MNRENNLSPVEHHKAGIGILSSRNLDKQLLAWIQVISFG